MESIYLDHNATTPLLPAVWEAMRPFALETFANPASAHRAGQRARRALEDARERVAELLDAQADEVVFTSGATEANNLALFGLCGAGPGHIAASPVEHPSVAEPVRRLGQTGFVVAWLPVNAAGHVAPESVATVLRPETRVLAVQLANHETGTLQPVRDLAAAAGGTPLHCDAVQAVGKLPVRFHELGAATLSLSAHKFHGPKGVGALLVRRGTRLAPLLHGGHQQQGRRPGTEPVALVVGLARALELAHDEMAARWEKVSMLRHTLLQRLQMDAAPLEVNGAAGVPHTLNVSFPGCRADALLMNLDLAGVACATGSACSSGSLLPSPVLQALGIEGDRLHSAMRFSLSALLTEEEVEEAGRRIVGVVKRLRDTAEASSGVT